MIKSGPNTLRYYSNVASIKAPAAWKHSTGQRVRIGIIDTGIDIRHPDLRRSIAGGINLLFPQMPPYDDNGHGTHIAGTIAASSESNGARGIAPGALLYAIKAFDSNGTAYVSDIVSGIDWCVRHRIRIINMSFGLHARSRALEEAINRAYRAGAIIVASSGNDGRRSIDYPGRYPEVISVGATNRSGEIAVFSNKSRSIDIYAPGENIRSTWPHGRYGQLNGTSMATSHVSGVVALMLAVKPQLRSNEIRNLLQKSATPLRTRDSRIRRFGIVQAERAVLLAILGNTGKVKPHQSTKLR